MPNIDWSHFIEQYRQNDAHWYVSKIKSYDIESLRQLRQGLKLLDQWFVRFESLAGNETALLSTFVRPKLKGSNDAQEIAGLYRWTPATELFFAWLLDRHHVISQVNRPTGIRERYNAILQMMDEGKSYRNLKTRFGEKLLNDLAANARNFSSVFKKLGLAWVQSGQTVSITLTGERFKDASSDEELRAIFERQVLKWQLYNPTLSARYRDLRIFPLIFLLQILLQLKPAQLSKLEYVLFVTKAQKMDELERVIGQIVAWRTLSQEQHEEIIKALSQPQSARRRPVFIELADSANKEMEFFALTSPLRRTTVDGAIGITLADHKRAQHFVSLRGKKPVFIEFESELDWFSYYGDWTTGPTVADAIEYYAQIGEIEKAQTLASQPDATKQDKSRVRQAVQERHIEDYFIEHLDLIEKGLRLYQQGNRSGKQYKTPINRIDSLCLDRHNQFVIVEYKKNKSADETVGQTLRYMGWVRINLAGGKKVRGVIVAEKIDDKTKYAIQGMQWPRGSEPITLLEHSFKINPVKL
ncbi:MAG: AlwI family type II restriction endonuclease [Anaerolineae bacterium]|nr:AlwI family type II restriction endonuclease [Anaerolineae bacterium]